MRRLLWTIYGLGSLLFILAGGCSGRDDDILSEAGNDPAGSRTITFRTFPRISSYSGADSIPGEKTVENLDMFDVWANTAKDAVAFMSDVTVTKESSGVWAYSPLRYWPVDSLVFFAFWPYKGKLTYTSSLTTGDISFPTSRSMQLSYNNYESDRDALVASFTGKQAGEAQLKFEHALSAVLFKFYSTSRTVKVRIGGLRLGNISKSGTLTYTASGSVIWSDLSTQIESQYLINDVNSLVEEDRAPTLTLVPNLLLDNYVNPSSFFYIPQSLSSITYLEVDLKIYSASTGTLLWPNIYTDDDDVTELGYGIKKLALKGLGGVYAWLPGKAYVYHILINDADF